jgi:hypothetical protein
VAQLFPRWTNAAARMGVATLLVAPAAVLAVVMVLPYTPYVTGQDLVLAQPVPFSHAHHVGGLGLDCRYCHTSVTESRFAELPPTETCMTCHSQLWTNAPMLAPVRQSLAEGQPLRWRRVHRLPDYVYFDHSIHVAKGVGCSTCHGDVAQMPLIRQAAPLTMGWCLSCHRDPAPNLRPESAIYDPHWKPPPDPRAEGEALVRHYLIETEQLTDCSICHR